MTTNTQALDDRVVLDALAEALVPIELAPERKAALRERILARTEPLNATPATPGFVTIAQHEGPWQPLFPGVTMKLLHDHGDAQSFLLRLEPGASVPVHAHEADELCVVLEGTVRLNETIATAGTFHLALAGSDHQTVTTDTGCLLFLRANLETGVRFRAGA